jgi:hypothetical protein
MVEARSYLDYFKGKRGVRVQKLFQIILLMTYVDIYPFLTSIASGNGAYPDLFPSATSPVQSSAVALIFDWNYHHI